MPQNALAFANNDVVTVAWSVEPKPEGCMGFAIYRIDDKGKETALPSHAVFPGFTRKPGQTTRDFPVQKFYWKDPYARLEADRTGHRSFRYRIEPLAGPPDPKKLTPMDLPHMVTNKVTVTPQVSPGLDAYFNRGLISTQRVSRALKGKPSKGALIPQISAQGNALRQSLAGEMIAALTGFVDRAKTSGSIYAALYELGDAELLDKLTKLGKRLHVVLANAVGTDLKTKKKIDTNEGARATLVTSHSEKFDRIMPSGHIGHNKFLVYVDKDGKAKAVLFGSTNWTSTGLCAQTNNTVIVEDAALAARYLDYWKKLAADTKAAKGVAKDLQAKPLRSWDGTGKTLAFSGAAKAESWFSPNTPKARTKATANEKHPGDMSAIVKHINEANESILFLAFYPGTPSVADWAADAQKAKKDLFVRGCVTNPSASAGFYYELHGLTPPKKVKGQKAPKSKEDPRVIHAQALDKTIPKGWGKELLNAGFAIVHDKIVVIDPFSDNCVVATGSHNLGHRASFNNDENLVIVKGNKELAKAYATHVLDVYDHFIWRWWVQQHGEPAQDQSLKTKPDDWMDVYYGADGTIRTAQLKFWMGAQAT